MLTALAFLLGFFALLALALVRHPIFGLYAYLASFYIHPPSRWWAQNLPDLRWALLSAFVTLVALYVHRDKLNKAPPWFANAPAALLTLYCLWMWIQVFWAVDAQAHWNGTLQFSKYLVAFYLCYRLLDSPQRLRDFLLVHLAGCFYLGVQAFLSSNFTGGRLNGVGGPGIDDANTLGMFLATGVVAGAALALSQSGWRLWGTFAGLAFAMNGLVLTASRGAFLGLMAGGALVSMLHPKRLRWRFLVLAAIAALGFLSIVDDRFVQRMLSLVEVVERTEDIDMSAESRFEIKKAQMQMFLDYPFGTGHKGTAALSPLYMDRKWLAVTRRDGQISVGRSSHNTFLTTLAEQGFVGASLFIALVFWVAKTSWRIWRDRNRTNVLELPVITAGFAGGVWVVLVAGIGTDYLMAEVQFWMLAGLVVALRALAMQDSSRNAPETLAISRSSAGVATTGSMTERAAR
jgi:O-antigen ligase